MSSPIQKVVVVGPSGKLGEKVISHLISSSFTVTCVTRDVSKAKSILPEELVSKVSLHQIDYSAPPSTNIPILENHDAAVILTPRDAIDAQITIIDLLIAAKVPYIIPSAFGIDISNERVRKLPVYAGKAKVDAHIREQAARGFVTFNEIQTGIFFDWAMWVGLLADCRPTGVTVLFDDGNTKVSVSTFNDIGRAVTACLRKKSQITPNTTLFIQTAAVSQNQILEYATSLNPNKRFDVVQIDTAESERLAWEAYNKGDTESKQVRMGFMSRVSFGEGLGLFARLDNELLDVVEADENAIKEIMKRFV